MSPKPKTKSDMFYNTPVRNMRGKVKGNFGPKFVFQTCQEPLITPTSFWLNWIEALILPIVSFYLPHQEPPTRSFATTLQKSRKNRKNDIFWYFWRQTYLQVHHATLTLWSLQNYFWSIWTLQKAPTKHCDVCGAFFSQTFLKPKTGPFQTNLAPDTSWPILSLAFCFDFSALCILQQPPLRWFTTAIWYDIDTNTNKHSPKLSAWRTGPPDSEYFFWSLQTTVFGPFRRL